jgi:hypothetical protein
MTNREAGTDAGGNGSTSTPGAVGEGAAALVTPPTRTLQRRLLDRVGRRPGGVESTSIRRYGSLLVVVSIATVLVLSGCGEPRGWVARMRDPNGHPVTQPCGPILWGVRSTTTTDPSFRMDVVNVIWQLHQLTGREFVEVAYDGARIRVTDAWPSGNHHPGYAEITGDGWHFVRNTVYLNPVSTAIGSEFRLRTLRHEVGHALGMDHTTASPSVMNTGATVLDYSAEIDIPALRYLAGRC